MMQKHTQNQASFVAASEDTYKSLAFMLNTTIGFFSSHLDITGMCAMDVLIEALTLYKSSKPIVASVNFKPDKIQTSESYSTTASLICLAHSTANTANSAIVIAQEVAQTNLSKRKPDYSTMSGSRFGDFEIKSPSRSTSQPINLSGMAQVDIDPENQLHLCQLMLKQYSYQDYLDKFGKCDNSYVEVKGPEDRKLAKLYSISCGLHDRYFASAVKDVSYFYDRSKLDKIAEKIQGDIFPMKTENLPTETVNLINSLVFRARTPEDIKILQDNGFKGFSNEQMKYCASGEKMYVGKGRNGRPDLVLYNKRGLIKGVVELKRPKTVVSKGNHTVHLKQAAHYCHMFSAVETFLVYIPAYPYRAPPSIHKITQDILNVTECEMETMQHNYQLIRESMNSIGN